MVSKSFELHLQHASEVVSYWPAWKQRVLGGQTDNLELIKRRSRKNLDLNEYGKGPHHPHELFFWRFDNVPEEQKILRMLVSDDGGKNIHIPDELLWLKKFIDSIGNFDQYHFDRLPFVYVTVRSGLVDSVTDDEWHVDGFSMKVRHVPERDYIWCDSYPSQYCDENIIIPDDFDPMYHNLHWFLQDYPKKNIFTANSYAVNLIDPYVVHRRDPESNGKTRTFVRLSYVPIPIEDGMNTKNPVLNTPDYDVNKFRDDLIRYR